MIKAIAVSLHNYDLIGVALSTLCGIHCLVTPLVILYLPIIGDYFQSPWVHTLLIGFVVFAFHRSVYSEYKQHHSKMILGIGLIGLGILIPTLFIEIFAHSHEHTHHAGHTEIDPILYLTMAGSLLLVTSHILNMRKCRCLKSDRT